MRSLLMPQRTIPTLFEKYAPLVKSGGVLYIDNMYMHGLSDLELKDVPRRKRTMIRNLKTSRIGLCKDPDYTSAFYQSVMVYYYV